MSDFIAYVTAHWAEIFQVITSIIGAFTIIAKLTPTATDDKIVDFFLKVINLGALNVKKDAKVEATAEIVDAGVASASTAANAVTGVTTDQVVKATK